MTPRWTTVEADLVVNGESADAGRCVYIQVASISSRNRRFLRVCPAFFVHNGLEHYSRRVRYLAP